MIKLNKQDGQTSRRTDYDNTMVQACDKYHSHILTKINRRPNSLP